MALGFKVILISIGIIKMAECRHISKSSIMADTGCVVCLLIKDVVVKIV